MLGAPAQVEWRGGASLPGDASPPSEPGPDASLTLGVPGLDMKSSLSRNADVTKSTPLSKLRGKATGNQRYMASAAHPAPNRPSSSSSDLKKRKMKKGGSQRGDAGGQAARQAAAGGDCAVRPMSIREREKLDRQQLVALSSQHVKRLSGGELGEVDCVSLMSGYSHSDSSSYAASGLTQVGTLQRRPIGLAKHSAPCLLLHGCKHLAQNASGSFDAVQLSCSLTSCIARRLCNSGRMFCFLTGAGH